jgi:hypothetical protein
MSLEISIILGLEQINISCLIEAMVCTGSTKLSGKCRIDRPSKASNNKSSHKEKGLNPHEMNEALIAANLSINCSIQLFFQTKEP